MSILQPFTELNINMTRIETRPSRNNDYLHTFIDFEGYYERGNNRIIRKIGEYVRRIKNYRFLFCLKLTVFC